MRLQFVTHGSWCSNFFLHFQIFGRLIWLIYASGYGFLNGEQGFCGFRDFVDLLMVSFTHYFGWTSHKYPMNHVMTLYSPRLTYYEWEPGTIMTSRVDGKRLQKAEMKCVWERRPSKIERKDYNHPVHVGTHVASDKSPILSPDQQSSCALLEIDLHKSLLGSNRGFMDMLTFENNSVNQSICTTPHDDDSLRLRHPNGSSR